MLTRKRNLFLNILNNSVINLPTPKNISYWWNFGRLLGLCLIIQIISGLFLALHYNNDENLAFVRVVDIIRNINNGWLLRLFHMNGARFFFICLFCHIGRNLFYESFYKTKTWLRGIIIFFLTIITAFIGYVLPWGQISFWGVTVITNLFSAFPVIGTPLTQWLWGGFSVEGPTLRRFFSFHFLLPFIILILVIGHLILLHEAGSANPLGVDRSFTKILFHPFFTLKDFLGFLVLLFLFIIVIRFNPWIFSDAENFIPANSIDTPHKIVPEWYFLFAYAILRSIPRKIGGVLAIFCSIMTISLITLYRSPVIPRGKTFNPAGKFLFSIFLIRFVVLTWIGGQPAHGLYVLVGRRFTFLYFIYFFRFPAINRLWWALMKK